MNYQEILDDLHIERGVSYAAIAALIGVNERTVRAWANGEQSPHETHGYRLRILARVAHAEIPQAQRGAYAG